MNISVKPITARQSGWRHDWRNTAAKADSAVGYRLICPAANADVRPTEIQCHLQPDNSGVVILPTEITTAGSNVAIFEAMLRESRRLLHTDLSADQIRCVLPVDSVLSGAIARAGFCKTEQLTTYSDTNSSLTRPGLPPNLEISCSSATKLEAVCGGSDLESLLQAILQDSRDAVSVRIPKASVLLKLWSLINPPVDVLQAKYQQTPIGLAVISVDEDDRVATLEYLGVHPNQRRKGVGTKLVNAARTAIGQHPEHSGLRLSVTATETNIAAGQLYSTTGFTISQRHFLWLAD